jgi:hypothetical protein
MMQHISDSHSVQHCVVDMLIRVPLRAPGADQCHLSNPFASTGLFAPAHAELLGLGSSMLTCLK